MARLRGRREPGERIPAASGRVPLVAGNWKMNLNHLEAIALVQQLAFRLDDADHDRAEVVVLPPFTDLRSVQTLVDGDGLRLGYGAQDLSTEDGGAYTGEISGAMLARLGCTYALVGHSERRQHQHEDDALVAAKLQAALRHDLTPILCVGEGAAVREAGKQVEHVLDQVAAALTGVDAEQQVVLAYEPLWAIGTGQVATPDDAQQVCAAIRHALAEGLSAEFAARTRILYGGSAKPDNIAELAAEPDVDGALVGGASLSAEDFAVLCRLGT